MSPNTTIGLTRCVICSQVAKPPSGAHIFAQDLWPMGCKIGGDQTQILMREGWRRILFRQARLKTLREPTQDNSCYLSVRICNSSSAALPDTLIRLFPFFLKPFNNLQSATTAPHLVADPVLFATHLLNLYMAQLGAGVLLEGPLLPASWGKRAMGALACMAHGHECVCIEPIQNEVCM